MSLKSYAFPVTEVFKAQICNQPPEFDARGNRLLQNKLELVNIDDPLSI